MKLTLALLLLSPLLVICIPSTSHSRTVGAHTLTSFPHQWEDVGVDIGIIVVTKANLRAEPISTGEVIRQLPRGEVVVLLSRRPEGSWFNVIHVGSSVEGWINESTIKIRYTEKRNSGPVFQERDTGRYEDPLIRVTNDSNRTLYLRVGDADRIVISPHDSKTITRVPGKYSFYASSPGVIPALGEKDFRMGIMYEWSFYIVTTYR